MISETIFPKNVITAIDILIETVVNAKEPGNPSVKFDPLKYDEVSIEVIDRLRFEFAKHYKLEGAGALFVGETHNHLHELEQKSRYTVAVGH